jgi:hypothetical protein
VGLVRSCPSSSFPIIIVFFFFLLMLMVLMACRVGLYPLGSSTYVEYHYVDPTGEPRCTFAVPKEPGQYELRYFASATSSFLGSAQQQRRSTKVTVLPATAQSRTTF